MMTAAGGKPVKVVRPEDSKRGQEFNFSGVIIKIIEVNRAKFKMLPDQFTVAWKLIDTRVIPPFESQVAHLFLTASSNLHEEVRKVVDLYEQQRESIFKVKLPANWDKENVTEPNKE